MKYQTKSVILKAKKSKDIKHKHCYFNYEQNDISELV